MNMMNIEEEADKKLYTIEEIKSLKEDYIEVPCRTIVVYIICVSFNFMETTLISIHNVFCIENRECSDSC